MENQNLPDITDILSGKIAITVEDQIMSKNAKELAYGVPADNSASLSFSLLWTTKIANEVAERRASRSDSG